MTTVASASQSWDDFVNNLSTDLAPLVSLFGEQVTKQFLSESLSIWDNFIFAMAPLGILTAVVSTIRVLGSTSLKAFIGRAQEGPGNAELELLSCTSETTAELWDEGGIARVFGTPQILEVVRLKSGYIDYDGDAGIVTFVDENGLRPKGPWREIKSLHEGVQEKNLEQRSKMPIRNIFNRALTHHNPNLSLNIGIRTRAHYITILVALTGAVLQIGVLVYAGLTTYKYPNSFLKNGLQPPGWAYPITCSGTIMICIGMFISAYLIEQATTETYFEKLNSDPGDDKNGPDGEIFWVQAGGQKVGDQLLKAFLGRSGNRKTYVISRRAPKPRTTSTVSDVFHALPSSWTIPRIFSLLWASLITSIAGFVLQFVGLRYLHSSVALCQLGATLVMAGLRAGLRTQRMNADMNLFQGYNKIINGHELDMLAMKLVGDDRLFDLTSWRTKDIPPQQSKRLNDSTKLFSVRRRLAELTSTPIALSDTFGEDSIRVLSNKLQKAISDSINILYDSTADIKKRAIDRTRIDCPLHICRKDRIKPELFPPKFEMRPDVERHTEVIFLTVQREDQITGRGAAWESSSYELEAILGLAAWSRKVAFGKRPPAKGKRWPFSRVMMRCDKEEDRVKAEVEYRLWIQDKLDISPYPLSSSRAPFNDFYRFGDTVVWPPIDSAQAMSQFQFLRVLVNQPEDVLLAQDIYIAFLVYIFSELFETVCQPDEIWIEEDRKGNLHFHSRIVDDLANAFAESGLGSKEEGHMCVYPALKRCGKEPTMDDAYYALHRKVEELRKDNNWPQAERWLRWMIKHCSESNQYRVQEDLAELYREAIQSTNETSKEIGVVGMSNLLNDPSIPEDIEDGYRWLLNHVVYGGPYQGEYEAIRSTLSIDQCIERNDPKSYIVFKYLIGQGTDMNTRDSNNRNYLMKAIIHDNQSVANWLLLQEKFEVNTADSDGKTALHYASIYDRPIIDRIIDRNKALLGAKDEFRRTALHLAVLNDQRRAVMVLIKRGLDVNAVDKDGHTALGMTVERKSPELFSIILNSDQLNREPGTTTALHSVANLDFPQTPEYVKRILDAGISINVVDSANRTALHYAAANWNIGVTRVLVAYPGIRLDIVDKNNCTPWLSAAASQSWSDLRITSSAETIEAKETTFLTLSKLLYNNTMKHVPPEFRFTPFFGVRYAFQALIRDQDLEVLQYALRRGIGFFSIPDDKFTSLVLEEGNLDLLKLLIDPTVDSSANYRRKSVENRQLSALLHVESWGRKRQVKKSFTPESQSVQLASHKPDIDGPLVDHNTAENIAHLLLNMGADPNAKDKDGKMPLHFATNQEVINTLLEAQADPYAIDDQGRSPGGYAILGILHEESLSQNVQKIKVHLKSKFVRPELYIVEAILNASSLIRPKDAKLSSFVYVFELVFKYFGDDVFLHPPRYTNSLQYFIVLFLRTKAWMVWSHLDTGELKDSHILEMVQLLLISDVDPYSIELCDEWYQGDEIMESIYRQNGQSDLQKAVKSLLEGSNVEKREQER